jgi:hypothetical protein
MKYEMHSERTYCNDKSMMYSEVLSRISKDLQKTWIYKPIRDLYWECLKNCDYHTEKDWQPYALMKHKCGHRTVEIVAIYRNKFGRTGIIKRLKSQRDQDCFYCTCSIGHKQREKARSEFYTLKHLLHHLFSKSHFCDSCLERKFRKNDYNPAVEGDMRIAKPNKGLKEMDMFKYYY